MRRCDIHGFLLRYIPLKYIVLLDAAMGNGRHGLIPATRVVWGLTVLKSAANRDNALKFLQLLFGLQGVALQTAAGPTPISPPIVNARDFEPLPSLLRPLVVRAQARRRPLTA